MQKITVYARIISEEFTKFISDNNDRVMLWTPVALGIGIGLYFLLSAEPSVYVSVLWFLFSVLLSFIAYKKQYLFRMSLLALFLSLGFVVAMGKANFVAAPVIKKQIKANIVGRVISSSSLSKGQRVVLDNLSIEKMSAEETPKTVRIRLTKKSEKVQSGQVISVFAVLMPPSEPARPDGFQFPRVAWFKQLGGIGFAMSRWKPVEDSAGLQQNSIKDSFKIRLGSIRNKMTERIMKVLPDEKGAIAATLITGERSAVPKVIIEAYRDSGLAHLLSISGLHMSMVSGLAFVGVRFLIVLLFPSLALRYDIKKAAAVIALAVGFCYLMMSGFRVPTQRAFLMISLVFLAVLIDRQALSLRLVAWAATVVLLISPESLLTPGFQMSFAAVLALISAYESGAGKIRSWMQGRRDFRGYSMHRILIAYLGGVVITDLIASSATTPFAIYHFNRFAAYTMIGNLLAAPVVSICIMPFAIISVILMPFGLEKIGLMPMGYGIGIVNDATLMVSSWEGAAVQVPAMPMVGAALIAGGMLWLCLVFGKARFIGVLPIVIGLVSPYMVSAPDILVDDKASLFAVRGADGKLVLSQKGGRKYFSDRWLEKEANGHEKSKLSWEDGWNNNYNYNGSGRDNSLFCDDVGCIYSAKGRKVAFIKHQEALKEDCFRNDINFVISSVPIRQKCRAKHVIDRFDVWENGAYGVWISENGEIIIKSVGGEKGDRLWSF
ncbi:MAG: ComEC family competence protein [Alphaproteobacteria bacterium]|nr:ComEC family competence protein [Alphaproteobacteria bacterium]